MLALALNDVRSGEVLWGESFLCEGSGWLTLQDLIPRRIVQRLFSSVEEAGHQSSLRRGKGELSAFEHLVRGRALFRSYEPGVNELAIAHFAAAIEADPSLGVAHSYHALAEASLHGYSLAPMDVKQRVRAQGLRGAQLSPEESRCHGILSYFHAWLGEFEQAEQAARRAVDLNPCDADALQYLAVALLARGQPQACVDWLERAKDVNPLWPLHYDEDLAYALFDLERYADAAVAFLRLPRRRALHEMQLAACYAQLGRHDLARRHVALAQELEPGADFVSKFRQMAVCEDEAIEERLIRAVELALTMSKVPGQNEQSGP
jgi:tetratricopeptide (TPR) repeat protein